MEPGEPGVPLAPEAPVAPTPWSILSLRDWESLFSVMELFCIAVVGTELGLRLPSGLWAWER